MPVLGYYCTTSTPPPTLGAWYGDWYPHTAAFQFSGWGQPSDQANLLPGAHDMLQEHSTSRTTPRTTVTTIDEANDDK